MAARDEDVRLGLAQAHDARVGIRVARRRARLLLGGADAEGGRHGPGETEEDEAGWGGVLRRGQEWGARSQEAECEAG